MTANSTEPLPQQPPPPQQSSVRGFSSGEAFLQAMIADLADWLSCLHDCDLPGDDQEGFLAGLDSGALLCRHAAMVQAAAADQLSSSAAAASTLLRPLRAGAPPLRLPHAAPPVRPRAPPGSFMARDSIACFIAWCRALGLHNCVLFETEDLVGRKNPRSVVLCLLELARAGARFGLEVPELVHFEQEIEAELMKSSPTCSDSGLASPPATPCSRCRSSPRSRGRRRLSRTVRLSSRQPLRQLRRRRRRSRSFKDDVRELVSECGCEEKFPMKRLDEGKYLFGDSQMLIFVRVLRNHVMVRVGGGWDSLEHLLLKHDPCRREAAAATSATSSDAAAGCLRSGVPVGHREERERRRRLLTQSPAATAGVKDDNDSRDSAATAAAIDRPDGDRQRQQQRRKMSAPTLSMTEVASAAAAAAAAVAKAEGQKKSARGGVERQDLADLRDLRPLSRTQQPTPSPTPPSKRKTQTTQSPLPSRGGRRASLQSTSLSAASFGGASRIPVPVNPTAPRPPPLLLASKRQELQASAGSLE
uniref:GAR domain-containing protein n=1 Tax=Macrostomum lignano TaxID=282301 RepID=A0A1I8IMZ6_9PLAT